MLFFERKDAFQNSVGLLSCLKPFLWEGQQDFRKRHIIKSGAGQWADSPLRSKSSPNRLWAREGENQVITNIQEWGEGKNLASHSWTHVVDIFCLKHVKNSWYAQLAVEILVLVWQIRVASAVILYLAYSPNSCCWGKPEGIYLEGTLLSHWCWALGRFSNLSPDGHWHWEVTVKKTWCLHDFVWNLFSF